MGSHEYSHPVSIVSSAAFHMCAFLSNISRIGRPVERSKVKLEKNTTKNAGIKH